MTIFVFPYAENTYSITKKKNNGEYMFWPSKSDFVRTSGIALTEQEVYDIFEEMTVEEIEKEIKVGYERSAYNALWDAIHDLKLNQW